MYFSTELIHYNAMDDQNNYYPIDIECFKKEHNPFSLFDIKLVNKDKGKSDPCSLLGHASLSAHFSSLSRKAISSLTVQKIDEGIYFCDICPHRVNKVFFETKLNFFREKVCNLMLKEDQFSALTFRKACLKAIKELAVEEEDKPER